MRFLQGLSAGELFELLRPAAFLLAATLSAWVLASTRNHQLSSPLIALWTIGTLAAPLVVFPLYLIFHFFSPRQEIRAASDARTESKNVAADLTPPTLAENTSVEIKRRWTLPLLYLLLVVAAGAIRYYHERHSIDSHLARANAARITGNREKTIAEYMAALRIEDDPHTHNLLGIELARAHRWNEAQTELRAAEKGGEPDPLIQFNLAAALEADGRLPEAKSQYERFLGSDLCRTSPPDRRCDIAAKRVVVK